MDTVISHSVAGKSNVIDCTLEKSSSCEILHHVVTDQGQGHDERDLNVVNESVVNSSEFLCESDLGNAQSVTTSNDCEEREDNSRNNVGLPKCLSGILRQSNIRFYKIKMATPRPNWSFTTLAVGMNCPNILGLPTL